MDQLVNYGVVALNKVSDLQQKEKTIIVLGAARSGTSMMASVIEQMGVFIGDKRDNAVLEDVEISSLIDERKVNELKKVIEDRNHKHQVWGWKRPSTFEHLPWVLPLVRNPHLIFMFRDPLAIALRNKISMNSAILSGLQSSHQLYSKIIAYLSTSSVPALLVSYEKAVLKREKFLLEVGSFLDINPEIAQKAIKGIELDRSFYLTNSTIHKISGHVNLTSGHMLIGKIENTNRERIHLLLEVEHENAAPSTVSELQVEGGFQIDVRPYLKSGLNRVKLYDKSTKAIVNGSPKLCFSGSGKEQQEIIAFIHIPKTAGTSFRNMLRLAFGPEEIFPNKTEIKSNNQQYPPLKDIASLPFYRLRNLKMINGHYLPSIWGELPFRLRKAVFFREPRARLVSNIVHFQKYDPQCRELTLEEIFAQRKTHLQNLQLKFILGNSGVLNDVHLTREMFEKMLTPILQEIDFIGVTEQFDASCRLFEKTFSIKLPQETFKDNTSKQPNYSPDLNLPEGFLDMEEWLYQMVLHIFNHRTANLQ